MRLLIAEDERAINRILKRRLQDAGYIVDSCFDGEEALNYFEYEEYDGAIIDVMMPKKNGFEVLKDIRAKKNKTPVIFLTAKDDIDDKVTGLDLGANDYLTKPFAFDELLARIRAMTRTSISEATNVFEVADLSVDINRHTVKRNGNIIKLSAREFAILEYMIRNKGIVLSREKLESHIWDFDFEGNSNVIDVYISYLRKKIDGNCDKKLIHTIRGNGYVLREE